MQQFFDTPRVTFLLLSVLGSPRIEVCSVRSLIAALVSQTTLHAGFCKNVGFLFCTKRAVCAVLLLGSTYTLINAPSDDLAIVGNNLSLL